MKTTEEIIRLERELELLRYEMDRIKYAAQIGAIPIDIGWKLYKPESEKEENLKRQIQLLSGGFYDDDSRKAS